MQPRFTLRTRPRPSDRQQGATAANYEFDILEGDSVVAMYWFDFRGDDHGVLFPDGREVWLECRCREFVFDRGPGQLSFTPLGLAWLEQELGTPPP